MKIDLIKKVALVTGGADGIGKGCVKQLAQAGASVIIYDINGQAAEALSSGLNKEGFNTEFLQGDVVSEMDVSLALNHISNKYGKLDILINNAGFNLFKGIEDTDTEEWDKIMDVDFKGVFRVTKRFIPLLKISGNASIVNISSVHTRSSIGNIFAYAAAKGGVTTMSKTLCQELGPYGIRVNSISPGFTSTPLLERWFNSTPNPSETREKVNSYHPLGKIVSPEDIGNAAAFLSSNMAGNITGIDLVIDGGLSVRLMH